MTVCVFVDLSKKSDSHRAQSFVESTWTQKKGVFQPTELQLHRPSHCGELQLTACNLRQFLHMEHRAEDKYDLVSVFLVYCVATAENIDQIRLIFALYVVISRILLPERPVQAHCMRICEHAAGNRSHTDRSKMESSKRG